MTKYLVTGGAGFIGSHIVEALVARGEMVRVLDNMVTGNLQNLAGVMDHIEFLEGDVQDDRTLQQAVADIEVIFHLAALVSVPESMRNPIDAELVNAVGTLKLLTAAKRVGVRRLVLSSTCAVYGDEPTLPKTEAMSLDPKSPYGISKLTAEQYCHLFNDAFGQETVILRYFNIFGPRQDPSSPYSGVISIFVDKLAQGIAPLIYGDGEQTRDFVFVEDVVRANLLAAHVPEAAGQIFNICTGHQVSINQLFRALQRIFACDLEPIYQPGRPGDIRYSYGSPAQAQKILDWSAGVTFETGLRRLVESMGGSLLRQTFGTGEK